MQRANIRAIQGILGRRHPFRLETSHLRDCRSGARRCRPAHRGARAAIPRMARQQHQAAAPSHPALPRGRLLHVPLRLGRAHHRGKRVKTFMVYLAADCTGGGTNLTRLIRPGRRWCSVVDCEDDEYKGVTFKPIPGSAVFWENMHSNGTLHRGVGHASLPVKSGPKMGLNIWSWDTDWRPSGAT